MGIRVVPLPDLAQVLSRYDRDQLGIIIEQAIGLLDREDGDPDLETGNDLEDDFVFTERAMNWVAGPGCAISDPGGQCDEDEISAPIDKSHFGPGCPISDPGGSYDGDQ